MAWVLVTGGDINFFRGALQKLPPAGYEVIAVPDGTTALQLLEDIAQARDVIVLLRREMGQLGVTEFLSLVTQEDRLRWSYAYLLLDEEPGELPAEIKRFLELMPVFVLSPPIDTSDADGWADLLDAIALAVRQLPSNHAPL